VAWIFLGRTLFLIVHKWTSAYWGQISIQNIKLAWFLLPTNDAIIWYAWHYHHELCCTTKLRRQHAIICWLSSLVKNSHSLPLQFQKCRSTKVCLGSIVVVFTIHRISISFICYTIHDFLVQPHEEKQSGAKLCLKCFYNAIAQPETDLSKLYIRLLNIHLAPI
jgi:hypothetical protein